MMLGYRNFFRTGSHRTEVVETLVKRSFMEDLIDKLLGRHTVLVTTSHFSLGYLSAEEVEFAANLMDRAATK